MTIRVVVSTTLWLSSVVLVSYEQPRKASAQATQEKAVYTRMGSEGALIGRILFDGEAPLRKPIREDQDANCAAIARNPRAEDIIVTNGKLANVFVYLKGGALDTYSFEAPGTPVLLIRQCRFDPRVLGIQANQTLLIFNSDPTTHNIHPVPKVNEEWNQMQEREAPPLAKKFPRPEVMIPIKCNQHPWMRAYVGVLAHPFFAVSAKDGSFKIDEIPAGEYTLIAWHEALGEQATNIIVGPNESKSVDFVFNAKPNGASSSLLRTESPLVIR